MAQIIPKIRFPLDFSWRAGRRALSYRGVRLGPLIYIRGSADRGDRAESCGIVTAEKDLAGQVECVASASALRDVLYAAEAIRDLFERQKARGNRQKSNGQQQVVHDYFSEAARRVCVLCRPSMP